MGRKLDALLGRRRRFPTPKFKATASLAVSRLAVLNNQRQARCSIARSDVVQLLNTNNQDRAILRVEQVIKEQNTLDVYAVLEGYCHLLSERVHLFEQEKVCAEELMEAVSTLVYASTRCGEFPELQQLREIFTSQFGKEFTARATELRNNCGVNPKVIQKLSTRMPSLENKMKVLKEIASDNNIHLTMDPNTTLEMEDHSGQWIGTERKEANDETVRTPTKKYKDVADAAQAAFESAAYAAAAARAAVELSRSESTDPPPHLTTTTTTVDHVDTAEIKFDLENKELKRSFSSSSSDSGDENTGEEVSGDSDKRKQGNAVFDESDDEEKKGGWKLERERENVQTLNINRRPISVRSTWAQGQ